MTLIIGSDHVGYPLKKAVIEYCASQQVPIVDLGPASPEVAVDYPDFASQVCQRVASGEFQYGILICGTGLGMSMAANKHNGIRAALCHDSYMAHMARAHNDANVLCMGVNVVSPPQAGFILGEWLQTEYEGGRHVPRLLKISQLDSRQSTRSADQKPVENFAHPISIALSPTRTSFGPLLFAGQIEAGMAAAAQAGFKAIELSMRKPEDLPVEKLRALLDQHGLTLAGVATGQSCLHEGLCLAATDPALRAATGERIQALIAWAAEFNAPVIIGGIRGRFSDPPESFAGQQQAAADIVGECARFAAGHGSYLLIEAINRYETNFINTAEQGLAFIDQVGEANVRLLLDAFHMNIEERSIPAALRLAGDRLGYVHLADSNRWAPGNGHTDFEAILATLAELHYQGQIGFEILPMPDDGSAIRAAGAFVLAQQSAQPATA